MPDDLREDAPDVLVRGLDDVVLGRMNPPQLDPLSETALEYRVVTIAFLPPEVDRAEALLAKVLQSAAGGMSEGTWVNRFAEYDRLLDALTAARAKAGVKNTATAFGLLLDIVEKPLDELPQSKPRGKDNSPAAQT